MIPVVGLVSGLSFAFTRAFLALNQTTHSTNHRDALYEAGRRECVQKRSVWFDITWRMPLPNSPETFNILNAPCSASSGFVLSHKTLLFTLSESCRVMWSLVCVDCMAFTFRLNQNRSQPLQGVTFLVCFEICILPFTLSRSERGQVQTHPEMTNYSLTFILYESIFTSCVLHACFSEGELKKIPQSNMVRTLITLCYIEKEVMRK